MRIIIIFYFMRGIVMSSKIQRCVITTKEIDAILSDYKSIAAVNISPDFNQESHKISAYMQSQGYHVYPVCSEAEVILGEPVNSHLDDIRAPIDLVIVFGSDCDTHAIPILEQIKKHPDIRGFWVYCNKITTQTIQDAKKMGLKVVQDRCIMEEHRRYTDNYN